LTLRIAIAKVAWTGRVAAVLLGMTLFARSVANAQALEERAFVGNFLGYGAEPSDYVSIQGTTSRGSSSGSMYLEKTVSPSSSISLFGGLQSYTGREERAGWNDLELSYKYAVVDLKELEFMFSIAPSLEIPTGDPSIGAETHPRAGSDFLYQKGFGDLPASIAPLRALAIEGDFYWDSKVTGARDDLIFTTVELEYSIDYLEANVLHHKSDSFTRHLTPHIDFEYSQYFSAHRNTSAPDFELTPAMAWLNGFLEVNLGLQIGMNASSSSTGSVGFVWLVGVDLEQLWPPFGWTPFN
jgi:hypothetical protein